MNDIRWLLDADEQFFVQVASIYAQRMIASREHTLVDLAIKEKFLKKLKQKESREIILKLV